MQVSGPLPISWGCQGRWDGAGRGVQWYVSSNFAFPLFHSVPVAERGHTGTSIEDVKEVTEKFGPLKAVLGAIPAIYPNREVRRQQPQDPTLMGAFQESVAVENKVEVLLSHVVALEECFDSRPGDVTEQRRRDQLIRCVIAPPLNLDLITFQRV